MAARTPWLRRVAGAALWSLWSSVGVWTGVRLLGVETHSLLLVQLVAYTPYVAAVSVATLVGALVARRWRLTACAAVTVTLLAGCLATRVVPDSGGARRGVPLRVLTVNLWIGRADPAVVVGLVRSLDVDLLAVQELTTTGLHALDSAGLGTTLPYRVPYLEPHVSGLFSRFPLRDDGVRVHPSSFGQARATVSVPGAAPVAVESVHSCAPIGPGADRWWRADLANQPPATVHGPLRLLIGDFNATLDHRPLRRLLATGYRDAAEVRGTGLRPTWAGTDGSLPGVTIDHVLADRRIGVTDHRVATVRGTDHRAVFAALLLPPR
jgi:endonuclease/exonuclease/phosphatase (EEP) superfamily protein YafD